jgi:uncharacterized protein
MRRVERQITDPALLDEVFEKAQVLFLSLHDEPAPYVVPVSFGHAEDTLYVHGAMEGAKITLLRRNPRVGFSATTEPGIAPAATPCAFGIRGASVVGTGTARIVEDPAERARGLDAIMRHYAPGAVAGDYAPGVFSRTAVIAIAIETLCGKRFGA